MGFKVVYTHCNGGEFFSGPYCPIDGVGDDISKTLVEAVTELRSTGKDIGLDALERAGVPRNQLADVIVVEFPSEEVAWEFFRPLSTTNCEHCGKYLLNHLLSLDRKP
jgi:hypothetical protein